MGRRVRTGRLIVKRTRVLQPSPGMEPTRRQSQEPQERPQGNKLSGTIHRSQDPGLGVSVGQRAERCGGGKIALVSVRAGGWRAKRTARPVTAHVRRVACVGSTGTSDVARQGAAVS
jgi:hypothetical protein